MLYAKYSYTDRTTRAVALDGMYGVQENGKRTNKPFNDIIKECETHCLLHVLQLKLSCALGAPFYLTNEIYWMHERVWVSHVACSGWLQINSMPLHALHSQNCELKIANTVFCVTHRCVALLFTLPLSSFIFTEPHAERLNIELHVLDYVETRTAKKISKRKL